MTRIKHTPIPLLKDVAVLHSYTPYFMKVKIKTVNELSGNVLDGTDLGGQELGNVRASVLLLVAGEKFSILLFCLRLEKRLWKSLCSPEKEETRSL